MTTTEKLEWLGAEAEHRRNARATRAHRVLWTALDNALADYQDREAMKDSIVPMIADLMDEVERRIALAKAES